MAYFDFGVILIFCHILHIFAYNSLYQSQNNPFGRFQRQNVRFGYQNPILVAPTLPPSGTETNERFTCPYGTRPNSNGLCISDTSSNSGSINPPSTFRPLFTSDHKGSQSYHKCPLGTQNNQGRCIPIRQVVSISDVKFGHQRPILSAPTLPPSWGNDDGADSDNYPDTSNQNQNSLRCPSINGIEYRRDRKTEQCHVVGSDQPCKKSSNMKFYATQDPVYGECDCDLGASRPLVYHPHTDTCYFIYQQAYCDDREEWLTFNEQQDPICQVNPCRKYGEETFKWDWKRNSNMSYMNTEGIVPHYESQMCVPLGFVCDRDASGDRIFVNDPNPKGKPILAFERRHLQPTCHIVPSTTPSLHRYIECRPGSKFCILGQCLKQNYFDDAFASKGGFGHYSGYMHKKNGQIIPTISSASSTPWKETEGDAQKYVGNIAISTSTQKGYFGLAILMFILFIIQILIT